MPRIVLAFIGSQTCGLHPARRQSWPGPGGRRLRRGSPRALQLDRGAAVPRDDQAVRGERRQGVPYDAGADRLQGAQLGDRRQLVARREDAGPDSLRSASR